MYRSLVCHDFLTCLGLGSYGAKEPINGIDVAREPAKVKSEFGIVQQHLSLDYVELYIDDVSGGMKRRAMIAVEMQETENGTTSSALRSFCTFHPALRPFPSPEDPPELLASYFHPQPTRTALPSGHGDPRYCKALQIGSFL